MGVSGSGKTTLGTALAEQLGWVFADADDYHPAANRAKMSQGEPLNDADREPWLLRLRELLDQHLQEKKPMVLACSVLKERYRQILTENLTGIQVVFLSGSREVLAQRMQAREHFMPISLLDSQLATLEPPTKAIQIDIEQPLEDSLRQVLKQINLNQREFENAE
jgi:carbohydrate kinase (thermoresistant glucokinase family)